MITIRDHINVMFPAIGSFQDWPDPISRCVSVFVTGCNKACNGCSNPDLQKINQGRKVKISSLADYIFMKCESERTDKVCLLGGDPLGYQNVNKVKELLILLKEKGLKVCIYTGEEIDTVEMGGLKEFDFVKVGRYIRSLAVTPVKTDRYMQFASTNQALYDSYFNLLSKEGKYEFSK